MEKSKVLVVTICSNQKMQGGDDFDEESLSILKILHQQASSDSIGLKDLYVHH